MPVLVEALSVIVRRDAVVHKDSGGWSAFVAAVSNATFCADSEVVRVGFMHPDDVGGFIRQLNARGLTFLDEQENAVDLVVIDQREGPTTACSWVEYFHHKLPGGSVAAARLVGGKDRTLVCPDGWQFERSLSHRFEFHPGREPADLEFLGREDGVDGFRKRSTGEKVFVAHGRHESAEDKHAIELHNSLYQEAVSVLKPFLTDHVTTGNPTPARTNVDKAKLERTCELLARVVELRAENWNAWWVLGMAHRFLGDSRAARSAFLHAYTIAPDQVETGRNLVEESLALGYGEEAVQVATVLTELTPGDAGIVANRALALLVVGDVAEARREVARALGLDPGDRITLDLQEIIEAVAAGRRAKPTKWPP